MPESLTSRLARHIFNLFPAYFGTGGRITYIAQDWREIHIQIALTWRTRNYVGTIYGGSMYGALDPLYMIMLIRNLGSDYIVWDKAASIRFKKPGRSTLYARLCLERTELDAIRAALEQAHAEGRHSVDRTYQIDLVDSAGVVHASVEKVLYIRRK